MISLRMRSLAALATMAITSASLAQASPSWFRSSYLVLDAGSQPSGAAIGDLNADGWPDLVTTLSSSNAVAVRLGRGGGHFGPGATFPCGTAPHAVVVADVDGNSVPDIVTANSGSNSISVMIGNGGGGFTLLAGYPAESLPQAVISGDWNGDGHADVVVANSLSNT